MSEPNPKKPEKHFATVAVIAALVALFDALVAGQGAWALLLLAIGVLYYGLRALLAWRRPDVMRLRAKKAAVAIALGALALAFIRFDAERQQERVTRVIDAVGRYKAAEGAYPARLEALAPRYLPEVPRPRIAMMYDRFRYQGGPAPTLTYVVFAPFGRAIYHFDTGKTSHLD